MKWDVGLRYERTTPNDTHQPHQQATQVQAVLGHHGPQHFRDWLGGLGLESH